MAKRLEVYLYEQFIGTVERARAPFGRVTFAVNPAYEGAPDALTENFALIPGVTIDSAQASNFFGGYAPEGAHRVQLANKKRFDQHDLFAFLENYGLTTAGAVSFRTDRPNDKAPGTYRQLGMKDVVAKLKRAQRDFDLGNEPDSGRSMLPGFQPKLLLAHIDGTWAQPENRAHSTHILKPPPMKRPSTINDEFYSHQLSRHMGLADFNSELLHHNGMSFLAIERYDRLVDGDTVSAIHQEDAAQALGLDWIKSAAKFQDPEYPRSPARPSALGIAELMGSFGDGTDVEIWLRYLTYHVLVGNHDAHAKNVSILHDPDGPRIADLYDAVPILHINDDPSRVGSRKIGDQLSLAIGGEFNHHNVTLEHLQREASSWGALSKRRINLTITDTLEKFGRALDETPDVVGASSGLRNQLGYNHDRLAAGKSIGKPKLPVSAWAHS